MKNKTAVILGRFQPIHNGHRELIHKIKSEYTRVLVLVGKSEKKSERNPYDIEKVIELLLKHTLLEKKEIDILEDLTNENDWSNEWSKYLINSIKSKVGDNFDLIYGKKDADKYKAWTKGYDVNLVEVPEKLNGISATDIRKSMGLINSPIIDNEKTYNKKLTIVSGATGVGKTTYIAKHFPNLALKEFDYNSHNLMTSLTTEELDDESTQIMIAGLKYSHIVSNRPRVLERGMLDNLMFFDNNKFPNATRINKMLHNKMLELYDEVELVLIEKDWEQNKEQIKIRARKNELSDSSMEFYKNLNIKYKKEMKKLFYEKREK